MIEHKGKKFYTTYEIVDLINNPETEIHKNWKNCFPKYENVILYEQVTRILYEAKKHKEITFVQFTKGKNGKKVYYAFLLEDVISYINKTKASNIKFIDKEQKL